MGEEKGVGKGEPCGDSQKLELTERYMTLTSAKLLQELLQVSLSKEALSPKG